MKHRLANAHLAIEVIELGAELSSLRLLSRDLEYLWQADPAVWGRHSPILFPMVGRLKEDRYQVEGQTFVLTQHGFARDLPFRLVDQSRDHLVFLLESSQGSLLTYPFPFALRISYTLLEDRLRVGFEVQNPAESTMWFSIGAHPGFACPLFPERERYEDYELVFSEKEDQDSKLLRGGLFDGSSRPMLQQSDRIPLTHELFAQDALVFHGLRSDWVGLLSRKEGHGVKLHSPGWPDYGIWAKPNGDFVCLEPWFGHADQVDSSGDWTQKPGIISLPAGEQWTAHYDIELI